MPETVTETPGQKTMRRFYEGRLAERLVQVTQMAQDRQLLRRGATKQQDGTLGAPGDVEEEPVNISIGDTIIMQQPVESAPVKPAVPENVTVTEGSTVEKAASTLATPVSAALGSSTLRKALLSAALVASGAGVGAVVPWLLGAYSKPAATTTPTFTDTNTNYDLTLDPAKE